MSAKDVSHPVSGQPHSDSLTEQQASEPWRGPIGGLPPFDRITASDLEPAIYATLKKHREEIKSIAHCSAAPNFNNTYLRLEQSGVALRRVLALYRVFTSTKSDEYIQELESRIDPILSEHFDGIYQNEQLFNRCKVVYDKRDEFNLSAEAKRLAWVIMQDFKRAGALLDSGGKARLLATNKRLSELSATFAHNILRVEAEFTHLLEARSVVGVPGELRESMRQEASQRGLEGWVVINTRSVVEPFLTYATDRASRQAVHELFVNRCDGGPNDNNPLIREILSLRAERASLLGYQNHASAQLENTMAGSVDRAYQLMFDVWKPALARIKMELGQLAELARLEQPGEELMPWDYRYYHERLKSLTYLIEDSAITPYLQVDRIRDGMFFVASEIFGLTFTRLSCSEAPTFHPDDEVYQVTESSGRVIGAFYLNPYQHPGKRSGAWMDEYRVQENIDHFVPAIVCNECNNPKASCDVPSLLSWDEARTLLHEFGHALHGLLSKVQYPTLSGTRVPRDLVELPSQLLENWLSTPRFLERFALHYRSNQPLPAEEISKIQAAGLHDAAFKTVESVACAIIDLALHTASNPQDIDPVLFEARMVKDLGMPKEIVMRHRLPHFAHIFSSEYSAGYYSYLWADTLAADTWEAFIESPNGAWDRETAQRLHDTILSIGNTQPADQAYRAFRGRDVNTDALMRARGFI
ncbi:MAG: M3 family metallopeptidase [Pseudomonadota bacterium]